jgi:hypothetical protein
MLYISNIKLEINNKVIWMKKEYKYRLMFGPAILLLGIVLQTFWSGLDSLIPTTLMVVGLVLLVNGVFRHLKYGEMPERDERTRKIGAFAIAYSWLVTMIFIALLIWLDHFNLLKMTAPQALGLTIFMMIIAALIFQWHLKRKGDVE